MVRALWLCWLTLLVARPGLAQTECHGDARPWIGVVFVGPRWTSGFEQRVLEDLSAGLMAQDIAVCSLPDDGTPATGAIAVVHLNARQGQMVTVSIDVRDAVTRKRIGRDVALDTLPADGRAFALAVAAEELLRASWAELALEEAPPDIQQAPPQVRRVVDASLARDRRAADESPALRTHLVAARAAIERYTGGQTHLGVDLVHRYRLARRFRTELGLGARGALDERSANGSIGARAFSASAALLFGLVSEPGFELFAEAGVRGARVAFSGSAEGDAAERSFAGYSAYGRGALGAEVVSAGGLSAGLRLGLGAPLATVAAQDGTETATAVSGLELFASTQLGVTF